jgi:hypothetical protein
MVFENLTVFQIQLDSSVFGRQTTQDTPPAIDSEPVESSGRRRPR